MHQDSYVINYVKIQMIISYMYNLRKWLFKNKLNHQVMNKRFKKIDKIANYDLEIEVPIITGAKTCIKPNKKVLI